MFCMSLHVVRIDTIIFDEEIASVDRFRRSVLHTGYIDYYSGQNPPPHLLHFLLS